MRNVIITIFVVGLSGCTTFTASVTSPSGSVVTVSGGSLFTDKGIQKANITNLGSLEGYSSSPNAEAMRAFGEGLGAGMAQAAKLAGTVAK